MPDDKKNYPIFKVLNMGGKGLRKNAYLILLGIAKYADNDTGKCYPSVAGLAEWSGKSETAVHDAITELESRGRISIEHGGGRKHNHYTINFDVTDTESAPLNDEFTLGLSPRSDLTGTDSLPLQYGKRTPEVGNPDSCGTESGGELLYLSSGRNVFKQLTEAKAIASASANASQSNHTPRSGENGKNKTNIKTKSKDSGSSPNPKVSPVQLNEVYPMNPLILDTPWEQKNEDAFIVWKTSYARPYVLDNFLLIEVKFGERIDAVLDGHGTLPLIIKWACHISRDFRDLNNTTELREEFPHILMKITAYILAGELTPRTFIKRMEDAYWANLTFNNNYDPDPQDVLEEEYMWECDERETVMTDMFYPWAEEDAKKAQEELEEIIPRIEPMPDCVEEANTTTPDNTTPDSAAPPSADASTADGNSDDDDEEF